MTIHSSCIYCDQNDHTVPLIQFTYQDRQYFTCPQHLPILIHNPQQLAEKLPGLVPLAPSTDQS